MQQSKSMYDVVICGGGLAGQTLARQLRLSMPTLSILVLDKGEFPKPLGTLKVGESTIETSAFYLGDVLQLKEHLKAEHHRKFGLRFYWTQEDGCLSEYPELGLSNFTSFPSYQLDRGILENHIFSENGANGIEIIEGVTVGGIELQSDEDPHTVTYFSNKDKQTKHTAQGKWVIDAMGRRHYLQKKLGNLLSSKHVHSAAWFRIKGYFDIADLVPASETEWHGRVPEGMRFYATNHLMGDGYWVWILPLSSNHTSFGIVAREPHHEIADFSTRESALDWLFDMEPAIYEHLQQFEIADFGAYRDYTFASKQIFSADRWACTGDAALFSDPFYAPGIAMFAYVNTIITEMVRLDQAGQLTAERVEEFDAFARGVNEYDTYLIQKPYEYFDHPHIFSLRFLWAFALATGFTYPQAFNQLYLYPEKNKRMRQIAGHLAGWAFKFEFLFKEWAERTDDSFDFEYVDYLSLDFLRQLYDLTTQSYEDFDDVIANFHYATQRLEELAQIIFLFAVRDVLPEYVDQLPDPLWINPHGVSLDPERWERDGLFRPQSEPRDYAEMQAQVTSFYTFYDDLPDEEDEYLPEAESSLAPV